MISTSLLQAMLLSSQDKAQGNIIEFQTSLRVPIKHYKLVASHYTGDMLEEDTRDTFTLDIYRINGGKPAEKPHKTCQFKGKQAFLDYLAEFDFDITSGWQPVEDEA